VIASVWRKRKVLAIAMRATAAAAKAAREKLIRNPGVLSLVPFKRAAAQARGFLPGVGEEFEGCSAFRLFGHPLA
jgi:hypothetical protein